MLIKCLFTGMWWWAGCSVGIKVCRPAELISNAKCGGHAPSAPGWKNVFELMSSNYQNIKN